FRKPFQSVFFEPKKDPSLTDKISLHVLIMAVKIEISPNNLYCATICSNELKVPVPQHIIDYFSPRNTKLPHFKVIILHNVFIGNEFLEQLRKFQLDLVYLKDCYHFSGLEVINR